MYVCTICAFFRLCNYPCQIMRLSIAHISHNAKSWPILAHILQGQILRWRTKIDKYEVYTETTIWIGIIPFGELWLLQRKEDNQAVIFVICPHNWAFMEACYQLSLGLQVDFSME